MALLDQLDCDLDLNLTAGDDDDVPPPVLCTTLCPVSLRWRQGVLGLGQHLDGDDDHDVDEDEVLAECSADLCVHGCVSCGSSKIKEDQLRMSEAHNCT